MEWYIQNAGKQEGPLSLEQMRARINSGQLNGDSYIFRQGLTAWKKLRDESELNALLKKKDSGDLSVFIEMGKFVDEKTSVLERSKVNLLKKEQKQAEKLAVKQKAAPKRALEVQHENSRSNLPLIIAMALALAGAGYFGITEYTKPKIPPIADVPKTDYEKLNVAAKIPVKEAGSSAEIALSSDDPNHPRIYLSSNLGDGTLLTITLKEVAGTILQPTMKSTQVPVGPLSQHLTQSDHIHVSKGQYDVLVTENGPTGKLLSRTRLFLGGAQDAEYKNTLQQNHAKHLQQAQDELKDINQGMAQFQTFHEIIQNLEDLMNSTEPKREITRKASDLGSRWDESEKGLENRGNFWRTNVTEANVMYPQVLKDGRNVWNEMKAAQDALRKYLSTPVAQPSALQPIRDAVSKSISDLVALQTQVTKINPLEVQ